METRITAKYQEVLRGGDARQKGRALEELLAAVFASIPGFTVSESNYHTATEELDLVLRNASADPFWREMDSLILVEAKHWQAQGIKRPWGKNEYVQFYRKLENRGGHCTPLACRIGFLICTERFAETLQQERLRDSKGRLRVVPIDGDDLRWLVEAEDRAAVLRELVERGCLTDSRGQTFWSAPTSVARSKLSTRRCSTFAARPGFLHVLGITTCVEFC